MIYHTARQYILQLDRSHHWLCMFDWQRTQHTQNTTTASTSREPKLLHTQKYKNIRRISLHTKYNKIYTI